MADKGSQVVMKYSEEEIEKMPDSQKLTVLVKCLLPIQADIYGDGDGNEGIKRKTERHDVQLKYIWLVCIAILSLVAAVALR